jgi:hypothetical protein
VIHYSSRMDLSQAAVGPRNQQRAVDDASTPQGVELLPVFGTVHNNYLLVDAGWDGVRRIHHIVAHVRLRNGKVWVEADNTNTQPVRQLLDAGLTKDEIVLAFYSPQKRPLTEFDLA